MPRSPGGVAGGEFLGAEDGDLDAGRLQDLDQGLRHLLAVIVVTAGRAHEEQVLEVATGLRRQRNPEIGRPFTALLRRKLPRVAVDFVAAEGGLRLFRELGLLEYQVAPHLHQLVDVTDVQRAGLLAPATGRARPDHVGVDDDRHQFFFRLVGAVARRAQDLRLLAVKLVADALEEEHRLKGFVGKGGRAELAAPSALGAGVHVEHLLPGEIGDRRNAERRILVDVFKVHARQSAGRIEVGEKDIEDRGVDVEVLGVRQLVGKGIQGDEVDPPAEAVDELEGGGAETGKGSCCKARDRKVRALDLTGGDARALRRQIGDHQDGDKADHQPRAPALNDPFLLLDPAPPDGETQSHQHQQLEDVLGKQIGVAQRCVEQRQFPTRKETLDDHGHGAQADHQEAVEDQQVVKAGDRVIEHLLLTEGIDQHVFESLAQAVETIVRSPAPEQLKPAAQGKNDGADSDNLRIQNQTTPEIPRNDPAVA